MTLTSWRSRTELEVQPVRKQQMALRSHRISFALLVRQDTRSQDGRMTLLRYIAKQLCGAHPLLCDEVPHVASPALQTSLSVRPCKTSTSQPSGDVSFPAKVVEESLPCTAVIRYCTECAQSLNPSHGKNDSHMGYTTIRVSRQESKRFVRNVWWIGD